MRSNALASKLIEKLGHVSHERDDFRLVLGHFGTLDIPV